MEHRKWCGCVRNITEAVRHHLLAAVDRLRDLGLRMLVISISGDIVRF